MRRAQRVGLDAHVRPFDGRDVAGRALDRAQAEAGVGGILVGDANVADQRHRGDSRPLEARRAMHQRVEAPGHHRPGGHGGDQGRRDQSRDRQGPGRRNEGDEAARRHRRQPRGHLFAERLDQRR